VFDENKAISVISQIETLGIHKNSDHKKCYFEFIFSQLHMLELQHQIVKKAIGLKTV